MTTTTTTESQRLEKQIKNMKREREEAGRLLQAAVNSVNFDLSLDEICDTSRVLGETAERLRSFVHFKAISFHIMSADGLDFSCAYCSSPKWRSFIEREKEALIEDRTIAWAIDRNRPVIVTSTDDNEQILLHSMVCQKRTMGMLIGILDEKMDEILDVSYAFLTVVLTSSAGILQNAELFDVIRELNAQLQDRVDRLEYVASHDPLTKLFNRRAILKGISVEMSRSRREERSMCIALMDLDHFKSVNDTYGHGVGDIVLQRTAERTRKMLRPYDLIGRYGGEEFLIVLSGVELPEALPIFDRLRRAICQEKIEAGDREVTVSASFGVIEYNGQSDIDELIDLADKALYRAKDRGRNRIST